MDELMEILTLAQTRKLERRIPVLLYGTSYWKEIINFDALVRHGMISPEDLHLFKYVDDPTVAFELLQAALVLEQHDKVPAFASSRTPNS